jgi:anti-sigma factor ChrR (cupin superfamily)
MKGESVVLPALAELAQSTDFPWQPFRPGVDIHRLYGNGDQGPSAALLRYAPAASVPLHRHTGHEHIYILRGSQRDDAGTYLAGTFVIHGPGTSHAVSSPDGCIVLVIWERPVDFTAHR